MSKRLLTIIFMISSISMLSSCLYRMPTDDDISTIPTTNNPNIIRDKVSPIPGVEI